MNRVLMVFITFFTLISCNQKVESKRYDEKGKLIIYNEEEYFKLVMLKGKKISFTIVDTFCTNQRARAVKDIKNGKLVFYGFYPREYKKMSKILSKYGIEMKEQSQSDLTFGGFRPYCYEDKMYEEICSKYGNRFIDSIFKVAQKEYVIENPEDEYIEDGIDLRKKYLNKKNSH